MTGKGMSGKGMSGKGMSGKGMSGKGMTGKGMSGKGMSAKAFPKKTPDSMGKFFSCSLKPREPAATGPLGGSRSVNKHGEKGAKSAGCNFFVARVLFRASGFRPEWSWERKYQKKTE
jgi:hypothetical protein